MDNEKKTKANVICSLVGMVIGALLTGAIDVFWVNPTQIEQQVEATKSMEQEAIVKALSMRFDFIDINSDYEDAIEEVARAYDELSKTVNESSGIIDSLNKQISDLQGNTNISNAVDREKEYAEKEDYGLAIDALNGINSSTLEIESLLNKYEEMSASQLWNNVRSRVKEGEYELAMQLINEYHYKLPQGYDIDELKKEVQGNKPMPISDLVEVDSKNWSVNEGRPIDNFNNEHYSSYTSTIVNSNEIFDSDNDHYVEYRSYKRYKKLTGTISPYEKIEGATVRILFDERTVETYEIGKKTDPIYFDFNISDVDYIRFEVDLMWSSGVIISDVLISK